MKRKVRLVMNMEKNMEEIGKRLNEEFDYEVGTDGDGKIKYMKEEMYENYGYSWNEYYNDLKLNNVKKCYEE
jgi:xanthine dehydrogenase/oxidase